MPSVDFRAAAHGPAHYTRVYSRQHGLGYQKCIYSPKPMMRQIEKKLRLSLVILLFAFPSNEAQAVDTPPSATASQVPILFLQESGTPSSESFAHLATPFPKLFSFSVCYRLRLARFREESTLMSYALSDDLDNEIRMDHRMTGYKVSLRSKWAITDLKTPLRSWVHFCFTFDLGTSEWHIYLNGERREEGFFVGISGPLDSGGAFIIGQEQDSLAGGFHRDQSFSGEITELNFWGRVLDDRTIAQIASCEVRQEGDVLSWAQMKWKLEGEVQWTVQERESVCNTASRQVTIFPDRFSLKNAINLCQIVGGSLSVPLNEGENTWMYESSKSRSGYCSGGQGSGYLWLGANDVRTENEWVYWTSGQALAWEGPWRGAGPNGGNVENCLVMLTGNFPGLWSDIACLDSYAFCVPCEFDRLSVLYLKGAMLCEGSPINKQYIVSDEKNGRPLLSGFLHSDIFWDPAAGSWVLQSLKEEGVRATWTPSREGMYPFGTHQWTLGGEVCQMQPGTEIPLTLSVCGKGEYTCADGNCIDLSLRCNLRIDCPDESDESLCSVVDIPPGYNTNIPPPSPRKEKPLDVKLDVQLIAFPSIVTQDLSMTVTFKLSLQWTDVRLNYLNLKEDRSLNKLSSEEVADIWTPRVHFSNALGNVFTNLDAGSRLECLRESPSSPGPPYLPVEVNIFSGRENSLQMSQLYHVTYTCEFDLVMFPFDSQVCSLRFTMSSASAPFLRLAASRALYTGQKDLIEYTIRNVSVEEGTDGDFSSVTVYVSFSRRYEFYLLTLYIPTTLLILIAYSTFYFNPVIFQPRIIVAITALLVLSSLFTQTSNALPKTSYFKMVDVWLFFSILIIFIVVFIQTLVEFSSLETVFALKRRNKIIQVSKCGQTQGTKTASEPAPPLTLSLKILLIGRFLIPLIVVIFNISYWAKALW
ncbi:uncharacterized protein [Penaeus vannamei]|uniref:uncharacterized protein n=1 Tax=Penaeus vannamei TaxID=6689 RepID=UPI00387F527D